MNTRSFLSYIVATSVLAALATTAASADLDRSRVVTSFDADWRFLQADMQGAEMSTCDDADWQRVDVPHDWSIAGPFKQDAPSSSGGAYLPSGISWYRRQFTLPASVRHKRVLIEFDGIMANSEIWINGHSLGKRPNGYVSLRYDLTDHLTFEKGQSNLLAVRTDTTQQPASRWYTGQGLYRHVRLVVTDPLHINASGVFVTTKDITSNSAVLSVQTSVTNASDLRRDVNLQTRILSPDGTQAASVETPRSVPVGSTLVFTQNITLQTPRLWSLESPHLYQAVTRVLNSEGIVSDDEVTSFGIRTFEFKADTGFWLNQKNVKIHGVCLHHDGGAVGAAVPLRVWERRLETLKTIGVNAIRTAHNPPAPEFLDLCDTMGFLVMDETFDTWTSKKNHADYGYQLHFREWWEADTRDTILRDRNHPSIILWSVGNEIRDNLNSEDGRNRFIAQRDLIHTLDPTRPVTMGLFRPQESRHIPQFTDLLDVVGINYRPAQLASVARSGRPVIGTEETHALSRWTPIRDNPAIPGTFLWTGIDYLGETGPVIGGWPYLISGNNRDTGFGLLDISGTLKARAYQRQSWWITEPMVHVARYSGHGGTGTPVSDWTPNDPDTFDVAKLEVYSNCQEVELILNDTSLGRKPMSESGVPAVWDDVSFMPGVLKAVARTDGKVVATHILRTAGEPIRIVLSADRRRITNEFDSISHVTARIVDENGITCPNVKRELAFKIDGPGGIVALSTGDRTNAQSFAAHERTAFNGECLAIVRATADSGEMTLTVSAPNLESASLTLEAAPASAR